MFFNLRDFFVVENLTLQDIGSAAAPLAWGGADPRSSTPLCVCVGLREKYI